MRTQNVRKSNGSIERDKRLKKVGKAPHHKPKYKKSILNIED